MRIAGSDLDELDPIGGKVDDAVGAALHTQAPESAGVDDARAAQTFVPAPVGVTVKEVVIVAARDKPIEEPLVAVAGGDASR